MDEYPKKVQTNPRYKTFTQPIFTAGDVEQFNTNRVRVSLAERDIDLKDNLFKGHTLVPRWDKYEKVDLRAVTNTFRYLFYKFKKIRMLFRQFIDVKFIFYTTRIYP